MKNKLMPLSFKLIACLLFIASSIFFMHLDAASQDTAPSATAGMPTITQASEGIIKLRDDAVKKTSDRLLGIWRHELAVIDDRPITIGKVISAVILLSLGIWLSKVISVITGRKLFPKLGLSGGGLVAMQSILFYILIVFFALFALRLANVPLTVFTVIGGALAIGLGFGSQTIMSNFISGLIMLVEQHVRVGDLIEIETLQGTVKRVGPRSTVVRTADNIDIVVPNSQFLEKRVVNWTLSDNIIRIKVSVGVAYESPVALVKELLSQAAKENLHVLNKPLPEVVFADFGASTIDFQLFCYVLVNSPIAPNIVRSELRYRIWELFQEKNITVAFPQRDLHLEMAAPVEIKLLNSPGSV